MKATAHFRGPAAEKADRIAAASTVASPALGVDSVLHRHRPVPEVLWRVDRSS